MTDDYRRFIASKHLRTDATGFEPDALPDRLFAHQKAAASFACRQGRAALFLDTGLGKSGCAVSFADQVVRRTNRPFLIMTPLAVARQMKYEAEDFGIEARVIREAGDVRPGVNIANYERLPKLDPDAFGGVALDESSILKSFTGATNRALNEAFAKTPYRLCCTATPAPNDHTELGQHSAFLGALPASEMLARWFITDQSSMAKYRLKGHAEADFWRWVGSWARGASRPSDLGGDDAAYDLPPLLHDVHVVEGEPMPPAEGELFAVTDQSATGLHDEKRRTLTARCEKAAELAAGSPDTVVIWCERNDESALIASLIDGAVELRGDMPSDAKEDVLESFSEGQIRVLVTKPKLAGFGLNWQHCSRMIFASISYSYEQYYQAVRRCWRFGQTRPVTAHVVIAGGERPVWSAVQRKALDHTRMKERMAAAMNGLLRSDPAGVSAYLKHHGFAFPHWIGENANAVA